MPTTVEAVKELVEPVLADLEVELVDVEHGRGLLRVTIDRPGGGVDLAAITRVSRRLSELLDEHDVVPGSYTLEVSSPGLERPLRTPAQFVRAIGTKVSVKTRPHVEGERRFTAVLEAADEDGFTVGGRRLGYDQVDRVKTVFEWGGEEKPSPGSKARGGKARGAAAGKAAGSAKAGPGAIGAAATAPTAAAAIASHQPVEPAAPGDDPIPAGTAGTHVPAEGAETDEEREA